MYGIVHAMLGSHRPPSIPGLNEGKVFALTFINFAFESDLQFEMTLCDAQLLIKRDNFPSDPIATICVRIWNRPHYGHIPTTKES